MVGVHAHGRLTTSQARLGGMKPCRSLISMLQCEREEASSFSAFAAKKVVNRTALPSLPHTPPVVYLCGMPRRPYHGKSRRSCFRNPCVVFFCVFATLATLRLRVRPKRAAKWIHKQSTHLRNSPSTMTSTQHFDMDFSLAEEGKLSSSGAAFQRYRAVWRQRAKNNAPGQPVSVHEWAQNMLSTDENLSSFLSILQKNSYSAFFFETRPVTAAQLSTKPFEFVLVDAPQLHDFAISQPDSTAFAEHFQRCQTEVACVFPSLNKDATLIAPKPDAQIPLTSFAHLAEFSRRASPTMVTATWKLALQTYIDKVESQSSQRFWFSTSGMGIAWLHFRVDQRPKYYTYAAFRDET